MRPVDQTKFGSPDGNCFQASVASILELPLEEVPDFDGDDWYEKFTEWLKPRGFYPLTFKMGEWKPPPDAYTIFGGKSPRGDWLHAVVGIGGEVAHDPHPDRTGLLTLDDATLLIPFDPAV